jgi:TRAP transporter 4TM/12TM fusion protein
MPSNNPGQTSAERNFPANIIASLALLLGLFHLVNVSGLLVLSTMVVRIVHLTAILSLAFLGSKLIKSEQLNWKTVACYMATTLAAVSGAFVLSRWEAIARSGVIDSLDVLAGVVIITLVIIAALFFVGRALAIITTIFLLYPFVCNYLPGIFYSRGYGAERVVNFLVHTGQGVYGIPIGVASTYIILFTIYGAFLSQFGAGDFFFKLARTLTHGLTAASAKAAVLFSALLGTISGSAAGNVAVTGSFTIPMMKKEGYKPEQAAAIEAVVSTGGQIMPPVMGAAAFIMAEIIGEPYLTVMQAAIVPAILFFVSILCVVHLQARQLGLGGDANQIDPTESNAGSQPFLATLIEGLPLIIPFVALIVMMLFGYSPFKACFWSIITLLIAQLIFRPKDSGQLAQNIVQAIQTGAKNAIPISVACAAAGIIAGVLAMSGLGAKLSGFIEVLSGGIALVALVLTAITAIILGMGLPTTAAYLILATVIAPALGNMGVPLLTAHMFVFFFGCISTITPPVALASYVAAGIANADINKVGWTAFRFGLVCFVLPFMFFYGPALLAQDTPMNIVLSAISGTVGVVCFAAGVVGFLQSDLSSIPRLLCLIAGVLLLTQGLLTDFVGLLLMGGVLAIVRPAATHE